jgi:DNA-binding MarR family transcriptional regulator
MSEQTRRMARECLAFRARMLSRVITSIYEDAFSGVGLKITQFSMLNAVANREESRPSELAKVLAMDESTVSRNIERMCAKGWLRLEVDADDRRSQLVRITDRGAALIRKGYPAWQKAQTEVARQLGLDGVSALKSALKKLRA